jgi:membrane protein DedA with SNARE-associated domain
VFLASFVSGLKNLVPAIAGASKMSTTKFVTYNAGGSLIRSVLLVVVGYVFGASFPKAIEIIGSLNEWLLGAVLLTVVVLVVLGRRKRGRVRGSGEKARDRVDRGAS